MARYYAEVQGSRGTTTTKTGTAKSGMSAHIRGWWAGVKVMLGVDGDGRDCLSVWLTGGSNDPACKSPALFVGRVEEDGSIVDHTDELPSKQRGERAAESTDG